MPTLLPAISQGGAEPETARIGIQLYLSHEVKRAANSSLASPWRRRIHGCDRRCVCHVQRGGIVAEACAGCHLEQRVVSALRLRRHQLHPELGVCVLRRRRLVDRSLHLNDGPATARQRPR